MGRLDLALEPSARCAVESGAARPVGEPSLLSGDFLVGAGLSKAIRRNWSLFMIEKRIVWGYHANWSCMLISIDGDD